MLRIHSLKDKFQHIVLFILKYVFNIIFRKYIKFEYTYYLPLIRLLYYYFFEHIKAKISIIFDY